MVNNQKGIAHILLILLLLAGIGLGVYLVQTKTDWLPGAQISEDIKPTTAFYLQNNDEEPLGSEVNPLFPGREFQVNLRVSSDLDATNAFDAQIQFPVDLLEVSSLKLNGGSSCSAPPSCGPNQTLIHGDPIDGGCPAYICTNSSGNTSQGQVLKTPTRRTPTTPSSNVACAADAQRCPDGSWVGRTGPNCEFVCPGGDPPPTPSPVCGGIGGLNCPDGMTCQYPEQREGEWIADQLGKCVPDSNCTPMPPCVQEGTCDMLPDVTWCPSPIKEVKDYFIRFWVDQKFDNEKGTIGLSGGVANGGIKTSPGNRPIMATIIFKAKKEGSAQLSFTDESAIVRVSDNINILNGKNGLTVDIKSQETPVIIGDINGDGSITLVDLSILLSKWGSDDKTADLNADGKVNLYDFSIFLSNWRRPN